MEALNLGCGFLLLLGTFLYRWVLACKFVSKRSAVKQWILFAIAVAMLVPTPFLDYLPSFILEGVCLIYMLITPSLMSASSIRSVKSTIASFGVALDKPAESPVDQASVLYDSIYNYAKNKGEAAESVKDDVEAEPEGQNEEPAVEVDEEDATPEAVEQVAEDAGNDEVEEESGKKKKKKRKEKAPKQEKKPKKQKPAKQPKKPKGAKPIKAAKIKHGLMMKCKSGKKIKLASYQFSFTMSDNASMQSMNDMLNELNETHKNGGWKWSAIYQNGTCHLVAYRDAGVDRVAEWSSMSAVMKVLPWYTIPFAVDDVAYLETQTNSAMMWKCHGVPDAPKNMIDLNALKGIKPIKLVPNMRWDDIMRTNELQMNVSLRYRQTISHGIIIGDAASRMNPLLSIAGHALLKNNVQIYVSNPENHNELSMLALHRNVVMVESEMVGVYEIVKRMLYEMTKRYASLNKLEMKWMPLNGNTPLKGKMGVNGVVMDLDERVHVRLAYDEKDVEVQDVQPGMEIVIPGDKRFRIPNHWEVASSNEIVHGDYIKYPPQLLILDGILNMLEGVGDQDADESYMIGAEGGAVSQEVMANEIRSGLTALLSYGNRVNIHLMLSGGAVTDKVLPSRILDMIQLRVMTNGSSDESIKTLIGNNHVGLFGAADEAIIYSNGVNAEQVMKLHLIKADAESVLSSTGVDKKAIAAGKKNGVDHPMYKPLRFDRYDYTLPSEMPKGVQADYGYVGDRREESKMEGQELDIAGRKIVLNLSTNTEMGKQDMTGLYGDDKSLKIGTAMLPDLSSMERKINTDDAGTLTMEFLDQLVEDYQQAEPQDTGRIDVEGDIEIVGDQTSLNSMFSQIVDDEGDEFHIVK